MKKYISYSTAVALLFGMIAHSSQAHDEDGIPADVKLDCPEFTLDLFSSNSLNKILMSGEHPKFRPRGSTVEWKLHKFEAGQVWGKLPLQEAFSDHPGYRVSLFSYKLDRKNGVCRYDIKYLPIGNDRKAIKNAATVEFQSSCPDFLK